MDDVFCGEDDGVVGMADEVDEFFLDGPRSAASFGKFEYLVVGRGSGGKESVDVDVEVGVGDVLRAKADLVLKVGVEDGPADPVVERTILVDGGARAREMVVVDVGSIPDELGDGEVVVVDGASTLPSSGGGGVEAVVASRASTRHGGVKRSKSAEGDGLDFD